MLNAREWYRKKRIDRTLNSLGKNGFDVHFVENSKEATSMILNMVPKGSLVGLGGSVTLREMKIPELLGDRGARVADHWEARKKGVSGDEVMSIRRQHLNSDVFITSTNALSEKGELVNIDGSGQRVAAMIFGPRKIIVVAGVNKIVRDLEEAIWRARNVASPMNAKRLDKNTPCTEYMYCQDCESPDRICNVTTIVHRKPHNTDITVILVDEELGY
jgi:L-lactate utilization protein LutB